MSNPTQNQTTEEQKRFAEFWGPLMPKVRFLKNLAHLCSGITQTVAIYKIITSHFSVSEQIGLIMMSGAVAILVSIVIETGISSFFPFLSRAFIRKQFVRWEDIAMIVLLLGIIAPLAYISPSLSSNAGFDLVDKVIAEVQSPNEDLLNSKYAMLNDSIKKHYELETQNIENRFNADKAAIKNKYNALISQKKHDYNYHNKRHKEGIKWAAGHRDIASKKMLALKAERSEALLKIQQEESAALFNTDVKSEKSITILAQNKETEKLAQDTDYNNAATKRESKLGLWGNIGYYVMLFCSIVVMVLIIIIEIYKKGSGMQYAGKIDQRSPTLLGHAFRKITGKISRAYWERFGGPEVVMNLSNQQSNIYDEIPINPDFTPQDDDRFAHIESIELVLLTKEDRQLIQLEVDSFKNINSFKVFCRNSYRRINKERPDDDKKRERHIYRFLRSRERFKKLGFDISPNGDSVEILRIY